MAMTEAEKAIILKRAQDWFSSVITENHISNARKLRDSSEFNINPFLAIYLANFLCGDSSPESIAKALIYPRVLGTSITTSFGQNMQGFASDVLSSYGSTTTGIDIEFDDCTDGNKKYCQLKAGPNTINKDDVETIEGHFSSIIDPPPINESRNSYGNAIHNGLIKGGAGYGTQAIYGGADYR